MKRTIILRVAGIGTGTDQAVFSSRPVAYEPGNIVCLTSATDSYSSELSPFSSRGSSPTMNLTINYTSETGALLIAHRLVPVVTSTGNPVTTTGYVPAARPATVGVTDSTPFVVGDVYSLGCEAVEVTATPTAKTITIDTARGSAPCPHPYLSEGVSPGVTLYEAVPGIEGLRCTVSVADDSTASAAAEAVIFRGVVGAVDFDTSAGGDLRIAMTLQSVIGALDSSPWIPTQYAWLNGGMRPGAFPTDSTWCELVGNTRISAPRPAAGDADDVPLRYVYLLAGDSWLLYPVQTYTTTVRSSVATLSQPGDTVPPVAYGHGRAWSGGLGRTFDALPKVESAVGQDFASALGQTNGFKTLVWQEAVCADTPERLLRRVLTGIDALDPALEASWATAAWLDVDAIDEYTLALISDAVAAEAVTFRGPDGVAWYALPPRTGGSDKGLLAWLIETIFEPAALALVMQDGVIRMVSWAAREEWPVTLTAADLAEPRARISFARGGVCQAVKVKALGVSSYAFDVSSPEVVYVNRSAATEGGGQTISLTTANADVMVFGEGDSIGSAFVPGFATVQLAELLVARYSRACPVLSVAVRDSAKTYTVGRQLLVTLATVPAADGTMGLTACRGIVTRSQRRWMQGVTEYGVLLIGYADAIGRPPMWSSCGTVVSDSGTVLEIAPNDFTRVPVGAGDAPWPTSDAQAWDQTFNLLGSGVRLALLDTYGTPKTVTTPPFLTVVTPSTNALTYTGSWAPSTADPGDVVVMAAATIQATPEASLDGFLAGADGNVEGPVGPFDGWEWLP